jgi:lipopolysaccharide transport protein LptA
MNLQRTARKSHAALLTAWLCSIVATAGVAAAAVETAPATDASCSKGNLRWSANDGVEYRRDKVLLRDVIVYECGSPLRIEAQRAEASTLDFDNSTWILTGDVKVRLTQGRLAADDSRVQFSDGKLNKATVNGSPASFEQQLEPTGRAGSGPATAAGITAGNAHGHAHTIIYDAAAGDVQFIGEAWLTNGCNEINGPSFSYNLAQKSVKTPPQQPGGGRVQGTIRPQCKPGAATAPAAPPP